ncbi:MAG: hypothetical protein ACK5VV_06145 [Lysobacteraceae bacterium]
MTSAAKTTTRQSRYRTRKASITKIEKCISILPPASWISAADSTISAAAMKKRVGTAPGCRHASQPPTSTVGTATRLGTPG